MSVHYVQLGPTVTLSMPHYALSAYQDTQLPRKAATIMHNAQVRKLFLIFDRKLTKEASWLYAELLLVYQSFSHFRKTAESHILPQVKSPETSFIRLFDF